MTKAQKKEITKISKEFFSGFEGTIDSINGSGWLIVDPLSAYLQMCGFANTLQEIPANDTRPQILIVTFGDGSVFIPAGGDMKPWHDKFENWMWIDKHTLAEWEKLLNAA